MLQKAGYARNIQQSIRAKEHQAVAQADNMYDTEGLLSVITLNAIASVVLVLIARVVQNETKRGRVMAWKVFRPRRPQDPPTFFNFGGAGFQSSTRFGALLEGRDPWLQSAQGWESRVYLQFLRMTMLMFASTSFALLVILVPINASSNYRDQYLTELNDTDNKYEAGIPDWSTRNIAPKSARLWVVLIMSIFVAYEMYGVAVNLMNTFMRAKASQTPPRTAAVDLSCLGIPLSKVTNDEVRAHVPSQLVSSITSIDIPRNCPKKMLKTIKKHDDSLHQLEHWYAFCEKEEIKGSSILDDKKLEIRPTLCGSKVNAIKHHRTVVDECYEELLAMKAEVEELESDALGLAYVTFNTSIDCCRYIIHANEKSLIGGQKVWFAPHPKSILWENMGTTWVERKLRFAVTCAVLVVLAMLWGSILAFFGSVDKLGEWIPFLEPLLDTNAELRGAVSAYMPVIALAVLNSILPGVLRSWTEKFERAPDRSVRELRVLKKFAVFSLLTSILLQAAAQGVGDSTSILEDMDTAGLLYLMVSMIVPTNGYFVTVVAQGAFMGNFTRLLQIGLLVVGPLKSLSALTHRELDAAYERPQFYFSEHYTMSLVIFSFAMLFSVNVPYIPVFGFAFFLLRYLVDRSTLADCYPPSRASDLKLVPSVILFMLVVLFLMQFFGVTLLSSIKERWDVFGVSIVPLVSTVACIVWVNRKSSDAMGPTFVVKAVDSIDYQIPYETAADLPTLSSVVARQFSDTAPQPRQLDFSSWTAAQKFVGDSEASVYVHPAVAYVPVKTDHAAMAARSFYCPPSDDPPAPTQRICASESVFFSNPTTPTKSADDHFGTFA
ncbi:hypothetical protein DIPPA_63842 [Diplonema papillatum]|nr:hypothetical protein DIPPA_63842 [Diplonema papillatum]KAJ9465924.1 hypothetical protein DIPPA_63842 [Diplonema papillatum]